jgi:hypothetical protein
MIARLTWRLRGLAVNAHPSDGYSTKIPKVPSMGVYLTVM